MGFFVGAVCKGIGQNVGRHNACRCVFCHFLGGGQKRGLIIFAAVKDEFLPVEHLLAKKVYGFFSRERAAHMDPELSVLHCNGVFHHPTGIAKQDLVLGWGGVGAAYHVEDLAVFCINLFIQPIGKVKVVGVLIRINDHIICKLVRAELIRTCRDCSTFV